VDYVSSNCLFQALRIAQVDFMVDGLEHVEAK
jgi:hypothetical protein